MNARALLAAALPLLLFACARDSGNEVQGYVEVDLIRLAPSQSGRLQSLLVDTGDAVQAGQILFHLDAMPEQATAAASLAHVDAATASAGDISTGKRPPEIAEIEAQLQQAHAALTLAQQELARSQALLGKGFVSAEQIDEQQTAVTQDTDQISQLEASLATARLAGRDEARKGAAASVSEAAAQNRVDAWKLDEKTVHAPEAAHVEQVYYRPGEWVGAGQPVLDLYANERVKLRFFVPETVVSTLHTGQTVAVGCDGCDSFKATIRFISQQAEFTPPEIYSRGQREKLVYLVEALPQHPERLHAGQPVDVSLPGTP